MNCVDALAGHIVESADVDGRVIVSKQQHLYLYQPGEALWRLCTVPQPWWQPLQRPRAHGFDTVLPLSGRVALLCYGNRIYAMHDGIARPLRGLQRPARIRRGGCAVTYDGAAYFGEFNDNRGRGPVYVYRWHPQETAAEVVYTFPKHSIRRVFGIYAHPSDGSLWCLTGDVRGECRILRTEDRFQTVEVLGAGDPTWCATTVLFPYERAVFATAHTRIANKVFAMGDNGVREELGEVGGPVVDAVAVGDDCFFAVSGHPCPVNPEGEAAIWHLNRAGVLKKVFTSMDKHGTPARPGEALYFAHANPHGNTFWFTAVAARRRFAQTYHCERRGRDLAPAKNSR